MDPILLCVLAVVVVVAGVLVLRLHPFLALCLATLFVLACTPQRQQFGAQLQREAVQLRRVEGDTLTVTKPTLGGLYRVYRLDDANSEQWVDLYATPLDLRGTADTPYQPATKLKTTDGPPHRDTPLEVGDWLLPANRHKAVSSASQRTIGQRLAAGFGETCRKVGVLIAMASVIGTCLLRSGAAQRVVDSVCAAVGVQRSPLALTISGFVVGIPVFFDTVFYLLMPLAKALRMRTGANYLLYVMSIVVGATMAHSLVPPTPGPLFVAAELGVDIGQMMVGGLALGILTAGAGFLYACWANRRWEIPVRWETKTEDGVSEPDGEAVSPDTAEELPGLVWSLLPIVLPVVLLAGGTTLSNWLDGIDAARGLPWLADTVRLLGDKHVALCLAAGLALVMLAYRQRGLGRRRWLDGVSEALASGGQIILITAAGGAFGQALRDSGIADAIQQRFPLAESSLALLLLAFCLTTVVRFAQGSATVAMITSVGIVAPLAAELTLEFHPVYLALAIGCGSKPLPWMNDSGFWIVGRMSGMNEAETLKTFSTTLTIMGLVGLGLIVLATKCLPLI